MASRSYKPASYLASAAQAPNRSPRPSFTRTSSTSSTASEDSLLATLRGMKVIERADSTISNSKNTGCATPKNKSSTSSLSRQYHEQTPGRKKSQPIAIELPHKEQVYTPLSARGDLPGGYFPLHEDVQRVYRPHPFGDSKSKSKFDSPIMSATSSSMSTPSSEATPRGPAGLISPTFGLGPLSPSIPEPLLHPVGKYHPANYQSPHTTEVSTPTSAPRLLPPTNLTVPSSSKRVAKDKTGHKRENSDLRQKLQQYQRDMIAQARGATPASVTGLQATKHEPISPKLQPACSPGPITPFELEEMDNDSYIAAGHRLRANTAGTEHLQSERHLL